MIVGTAGHVDHGKTALVKALTGVDGDRLKEEKARGITIDLGFAYMPTEEGRIVGFVDVPGHERFVHTMAAGAAGIDFALLAVAADDGVKPQTLEHIAILDLLGVERGIVAITKADLAEPARIDAVVAQVRAARAPTGLRDVEILPVSALTGEGVGALRSRLAAAATNAPARSVNAGFRLAIDRAFTLPGIGLIVTGVVLSGAVRVGDRVVISPSGIEARVRSLHAQNHAAQEGRAGERCALNISGPEVAKDRIKRGDMALDPSLHAPTDRIDARLRLPPNEAFAQGFPARLHHGAAEVGVRVVRLEEDATPGGWIDVQLKLERPIAAAQGDRFILRDGAARRTLGGGRLLDLRPPLRRRRTPERKAQRDALALVEPEAALAALLETPPFVCDLATFARDRALSAENVERLTRSQGLLALASGASRIAFAAKHWARLLSGLGEQLGEFHRENPDWQGMVAEKLRLASPLRLPPAIFTVALQKAAAAGALVVEGAFVRLATHSVRLSAKDEADWKSIATLLGGETRLRPPRTRDVAAMLARPERDIRRLLKLAARMGFADEVAPDHFFLRATMAEMVAVAAKLAAAAKGGQFSAAEFRDQLSNGRKVAIQILEFLDRHGVTVRRGELRQIDPRHLDLFGVAMLASSASEGGESFPVGRSDFKSEWGGASVSGGFDSHSPPPAATRSGA